jgi:hypothetical protein
MARRRAARRSRAGPGRTRCTSCLRSAFREKISCKQSKVGERAAARNQNLGDVDWLVELAGADVLGGGVLVLVQLHVAGRVVLLRHSISPAGNGVSSQIRSIRRVVGCGMKRRKKNNWLLIRLVGLGLMLRSTAAFDFFFFN